MRTALGEIPDRLWRDMTMADAWEYVSARRVRPSRRAFLRTLAAGAGVAAAGPVLWSQASRAAGVPPRGVHLSYGLSPTSAMTVSWSTASSVVNPRVEVGPDANYGMTVSAQTTQAPGHPVLYHHARIAGLNPGSTLQYRISHDGIGAGEVVTGSFATAPSAPAPFRFAAMGDMGANADGAAVTSMITGASPDVVFMVGDLCYADRLGGALVPPPQLGAMPGLQDLKVWDTWLEQIRTSAASIPWLTVAGNHEMEVAQGPLGYSGFLARMALPGNGLVDTPTFVSRRGNVAFVALDANDVSYEITRNQGYTGGAQQTWVGTTLKALRADPTVDFIVVGFHHCAYCSNTVHGSDGGVRDAWESAFDAAGVDLVINGHNHSYERTHPLRAGVPTVEAPVGAEIAPTDYGTTYVTAGGGGQAPYPSTLHPASYVTNPLGVREPELATWSSVRYLGDHSVLIADVTPRVGATPARLAVRVLAQDSPLVPVDTFSLVR